MHVLHEGKIEHRMRVASSTNHTHKETPVRLEAAIIMGTILRRIRAYLERSSVGAYVEDANAPIELEPPNEELGARRREAAKKYLAKLFGPLEDDVNSEGTDTE